jgi:SAM-dependent methyltransferase
VKTHDHCREKGVSGNVEFVTTDAADLPFDDESPDAAFPTMTCHELASTDSLREGRRVTIPSGRVAVADWSATGRGGSGPPIDERCSVAEALEALSPRHTETWWLTTLLLSRTKHGELGGEEAAELLLTLVERGINLKPAVFARVQEELPRLGTEYDARDDADEWPDVGSATHESGHGVRPRDGVNRVLMFVSSDCSR